MIGPIEVADIERSRKPSAISVIASSGRPPISPHNATGAKPLLADLGNAPQRPQEGRRQRIEAAETRLLSRSAA